MELLNALSESIKMNSENAIDNKLKYAKSKCEELDDLEKTNKKNENKYNKIKEKIESIKNIKSKQGNIIIGLNNYMYSIIKNLNFKILFHILIILI